MKLRRTLKKRSRNKKKVAEAVAVFDAKGRVT